MARPPDFIPYSRQDITDDDVAAVAEVLRGELITQGPAVPAFEAAFAARHAVAHAVAVSSGTAGLHLACLALGAGPGTRVWTSPNSFVASANCARFCGASVDFVDIDPRTRNLSVVALEEKLRQAKGAGTLPAIVIPVDYGGLPCDLREMRGLADRYGFKLLEDASHATGASYLGKPVGSAHAHASVFSFHAVKIVTTGEGGMVTTPDAALAERLRLLRSHGVTREVPGPGGWRYEQHALGFNYRLTDVQAALGRSQLGRLDAMQRARTRLADRYDELLAALPVERPARLPDRVSSWHLYTIEASRRDEVFEAMRAAQIGVNVHYIPIHTQPYYRELGFRDGQFPAAERYYTRALTLPLFPALTHAQQDRVVATLARALKP